MADHAMTRADDSAGLEALTQDRMQMWNVFTHATMWSVITAVVVLILMAIFLL